MSVSLVASLKLFIRTANASFPKWFEQKYADNPDRALMDLRDYYTANQRPADAQIMSQALKGYNDPNGTYQEWAYALRTNSNVIQVLTRDMRNGSPALQHIEGLMHEIKQTIKDLGLLPLATPPTAAAPAPKEVSSRNELTGSRFLTINSVCWPS
jgi:hypothetical protein